MKLIVEMLVKALLDIGGVWLLVGVIIAILSLVFLSALGLLVPFLILRINRRLDEILQILGGPNGLYHIIYNRFADKP